MSVTALKFCLTLFLQVDVVCSSRRPKFFHITVMNSSGRILRKSKQLHQPGQTVEDFEIRRLKNVDVCSLHVRIRAGNSAGMSAPSEAVEVGKLLFRLCSLLAIQDLQESENQYVLFTKIVQVRAQTLLPVTLLEVEVRVTSSKESVQH